MAKNNKVIKVVVEAMAGTHVNNCIFEAITMAAQEQREVELHHNANKYVVGLDCLLAAVVATKERLQTTEGK